VKGAIVVSFPGPAILAAYRIVGGSEIQESLQVALAASVLVEAIRRGEVVPPETIGRLAALAADGHGVFEFQRRLAEAFAEIQDGLGGNAALPHVELRSGR